MNGPSENREKRMEKHYHFYSIMYVRRYFDCDSNGGFCTTFPLLLPNTLDSAAVLRFTFTGATCPAYWLSSDLSHDCLHFGPFPAISVSLPSDFHLISSELIATKPPNLDRRPCLHWAPMLQFHDQTLTQSPMRIGATGTGRKWSVPLSDREVLIRQHKPVRTWRPPLSHFWFNCCQKSISFQVSGVGSFSRILNASSEAFRAQPSSELYRVWLVSAVSAH